MALWEYLLYLHPSKIDYPILSTGVSDLLKQPRLEINEVRVLYQVIWIFHKLIGVVIQSSG